MRSAPLIEIISRLEGLDVDECARAAFRTVVLEVGTTHSIKGIDRGEQLAFIRRLLALRVSHPTIRERVKSRYSVSTRQAYCLIEEAL